MRHLLDGEKYADELGGWGAFVIFNDLKFAELPDGCVWANIGLDSSASARFRQLWPHPYYRWPPKKLEFIAHGGAILAPRSEFVNKTLSGSKFKLIFPGNGLGVDDVKNRYLEMLANYELPMLTRDDIEQHAVYLWDADADFISHVAQIALNWRKNPLMFGKSNFTHEITEKTGDFLHALVSSAASEYKRVFLTAEDVLWTAINMSLPMIRGAPGGEASARASVVRWLAEQDPPGEKLAARFSP